MLDLQASAPRFIVNKKKHQSGLRVSVLKSMKRKLLFLVALLLATIIPRQVRASDDVYIVFKTGTEMVAVALADNPIITYANDQLVITTAEKQVEVPVADITGYSFTESEPTAIKNIKVDREHKQGMVAFDHLKEGVSVMLYNAKGEQVRTTTAQADGTAVIDMHGLAKGVYIIRTGKVSFKIINN
jgi:hypothetical protein